MLTLKIKYEFVNDSDKERLSSYIRQYNSVYRVAYNKYCNKEKVSQKELQQELNNIELLDSWFVASAMKEAKETLSRNGEKVVFGGKSNFIKRAKGKISREEFLSKRLVPLCSLGERSIERKKVHGNRKFKVDESLEKLFVKLKEKKIEINLVSNRYQKRILSEIYKHQLIGDVPLTYKIDLEYVYVNYDESILRKETIKSIENRVFAVDLNPNYIGWSIVDWKSSSEFKVIKSGVVSIKQLNDKDFELKGNGFASTSKERKHLSNKRRNEVFEISKFLTNTAIYYKCQLFSIEELNIKSSNKEKGKRFNKLCNNLWNRNILVSNLQKRCNIFGIKFLEIKPEYSSFIGNIVYRSLNLPDMTLASIEIGRRGYEFYNQYISKTKKIQKNIIQPNLEDFNDLIAKSLEEFSINEKFKDLIEMYYFFKKSKMVYRLSLDNFKNLKFSSLLSHKSYVSKCYCIC